MLARSWPQVPCVTYSSSPPLQPQPPPPPAFLPPVDEEFETVSTQLLKRTQAMLNKYRLLLLEESRVGFSSSGVSPCCELFLWGLGGVLLAGREDGKEAVVLSLTTSCQDPLFPHLLFHMSFLSTQRVSPSAEMVMIDRMFIQEEKTTLALDKQLAKEKPGERGGEGETSSTYLLLRFPASSLACCTGEAEAQ